MTNADDEMLVASVDETLSLVPDAALLFPVRIFRDPAAEAEAEQAYLAYRHDGSAVVFGTVLAIFGGALVVMCLLLIAFGGGDQTRTAITMGVSALLGGYGATKSHAAEQRREQCLATLRAKRPYVVTFQAENALRRVQAARSDLRSFAPTLTSRTPEAKAAVAANAEIESLHGQAWRYIRALDAATPTWRFDDAGLVRLFVVEKSRRGEHAALLALADEAEQILDDVRNPPEPEAAVTDEHADPTDGPAPGAVVVPPAIAALDLNLGEHPDLLEEIRTGGANSITDLIERVTSDTNQVAQEL